jgi:hypothetical protein
LPNQFSNMDAELEASIKLALPSALKMALYSAKKQHFEILKYALESVDSLSNNASLLKDYADEDHMATLEATTKEFVLLDAELNAYKAQLEKIDAAVEKGAVVRVRFPVVWDATNQHSLPGPIEPERV